MHDSPLALYWRLTFPQESPPTPNRFSILKFLPYGLTFPERFDAQAIPLFPQKIKWPCLPAFKAGETLGCIANFAVESGFLSFEVCWALIPDNTPLTLLVTESSHSRAQSLAAPAFQQNLHLFFPVRGALDRSVMDARGKTEFAMTAHSAGCRAPAAKLCFPLP